MTVTYRDMTVTHRERHVCDTQRHKTVTHTETLHRETTSRHPAAEMYLRLAVGKLLLLKHEGVAQLLKGCLGLGEGS